MASFKEQLLSFFDDQEDPNEPKIDPAHLAALILGMMAFLGAFFWLLWSLLVYGGGIVAKVSPAWQVLLHKKSLSDYGWVGYPYEQGIFQGFVVNLTALVILFFMLVGIAKTIDVLRKKKIEPKVTE